MISQKRKDELRTTIDRIERHSGNFIIISPNELRTLLNYADERDKIKWHMSETMEERENHHVAEHIQKMVYERMRVIAVKHGGAPESLFVHEAWREVIADMAQRELTPWEYIHTTP